MTASSTEHQNAPDAETCPPCIPFCGLSEAGEALLRLKQCGHMLLEQVRHSKEELPNLLSQS